MMSSCWHRASLSIASSGEGMLVSGKRENREQKGRENREHGKSEFHRRSMKEDNADLTMLAQGKR